MRSLNDHVVDLLSSGQVISGVLSAAKELIENALDAGARTVRLSLADMGLQLLTVTDDGCGIPPDGRALCARAYTTSKIACFEDLSRALATFGFRGEALHSLCCVGDVEIVTRCRGESVAQRLVFDRAGAVARTESVAAPFGTSVSVANLLSVFPVRLREERANFSAERLRDLLAAYRLSAPSVRFVVDAPPHLSQTRPPLPSLAQALAFEFGAQVAAALAERTAEGRAGDVAVRVRGLVPARGCCWRDASTSRAQAKQYLIVNGRPVRNSGIERRINELCWREHGSIPKRFPRFVVCVDFVRGGALCSSLVDVNMDPAKQHAQFADGGAVARLVEQLFDAPQRALAFEAIREWPSAFVAAARGGADVLDAAALGGGAWSDAGACGEFALFSVVDSGGRTHLVAVALRALQERCALTRVEDVRAHWEQLMEAHRAEPCVFDVLQID